MPLSVLTFTRFGVIDMILPIVSRLDGLAPLGGLTLVMICTLSPGDRLLAAHPVCSCLPLLAS